MGSEVRVPLRPPTDEETPPRRRRWLWHVPYDVCRTNGTRTSESGEGGGTNLFIVSAEEEEEGQMTLIRRASCLTSYNGVSFL